MECITWFAPILPGKLDEWKSLIQEMNGPRMEEYRKSRERMGLTREVVSYMETPQGDFVALFQEGEDLSTSSLRTFASAVHSATAVGWELQCNSCRHAFRP